MLRVAVWRPASLDGWSTRRLGADEHADGGGQREYSTLPHGQRVIAPIDTRRTDAQQVAA